MDATRANQRSYHHGDLRAALVGAGYDLARGSGAEAVTLRAVTRRAGVSPAAAYRHFASHEDLQFAVGTRAMADLARSIERHQAASPAGDPADRARQRLIGVGDGYIAFALDAPGAFDIAMFGLFTMEHAFEPASMGDTGRTPYELLTDAIDGLVRIGLVSPDRAEAAAITCWSVVHGFATLATRGPFREHPPAELRAMGAGIVRGLVAALTAD
jgi:AcrR family transcriptional regulator